MSQILNEIETSVVLKHKLKASQMPGLVAVNEATSIEKVLQIMHREDILAVPLVSNSSLSDIHYDIVTGIKD